MGRAPAGEERGAATAVTAAAATAAAAWGSLHYQWDWTALKRRLFATALLNHDCSGCPRPHYKSAANFGLICLWSHVCATRSPRL